MIVDVLSGAGLVVAAARALRRESLPGAIPTYWELAVMHVAPHLAHAHGSDEGVQLELLGVSKYITTSLDGRKGILRSRSQ